MRAFATLKTELVHRRTFRTRDQAREEIFRWIEGWYNTRRRHLSLDYYGPADPDQPTSAGALAGVEPYQHPTGNCPPE